jgi:oligopeptide/dipeptide ABC transporter ATP-binding protein
MGDLRAVEDVSFDLHHGETLGIVGESGSGKSVLARSIMGLSSAQNATMEGSIKFEGTEMVGLPAKALRAMWGNQVSMVFQDPMTSLNPVVKVGRQITEVLRRRLGMDRAAANDRALELLSSVGIPDPAARLKEYPHRMSGGMRQRVVIAIALAGEPQLLLADEPTTALDVTVAAQILDLLQAIQAERRMSMIFISHDLSIVNGRTDRTMVMYAGQTVEVAPTRVLLSSMRMPYSTALMQSVPRLDTPRDRRLVTIPGRVADPLDRPEGCRFAPRCSYATDICHTEAPPLEALGEDHLVRCWHPHEVISVAASEQAARVPENR